MGRGAVEERGKRSAPLLTRNSSFEFLHPGTLTNSATDLNTVPKVAVNNIVVIYIRPEVK